MCQDMETADHGGGVTTYSIQTRANTHTRAQSQTHTEKT